MSYSKYLLEFSYLRINIDYNRYEYIKFYIESLLSTSCQYQILEGIIKSYKLIVINNIDFFTCLLSLKILIIDFIFISTELSLF